MTSKTLVATPDPPEGENVGVDISVEILPEPEPILPPKTSVEVIDHHLNETRFRNMFTSNEVMDTLLDIRNTLTAKD